MELAADRLEEDVTLEEMARAASMSPFHMHRVFRSVAGETPKQFGLRLRLGRAASLLLTGSQPVLRVALTCGFRSHAGFTRAFKRRFGVTPSAYRARGFVGESSRRQAEEHSRLVAEIGPCVGTYHITEGRRHWRESMTYSISREEVAVQPVLVARRRVTRSEIATAIGEVLPRIFQHAQAEGVALAGQPFVRYHDSGPGLLTIEPGMRVASPAGRTGSEEEPGAEGEIRWCELPGGTVAKTVHSGPYESLHEAYAAVESWMEAEGLRPAGAPWETYVTDPTTVADPAEWKTEVCWPVE